MKAFIFNTIRTIHSRLTYRPEQVNRLILFRGDDKLTEKELTTQGYSETIKEGL